MNNMSSVATSKAITITNQVVRPSGTALIRAGTASTTAGVTSTAARTTTVASHTVNVPVATSLSFPLNIPNPANSGISITPISNGKSSEYLEAKLYYVGYGHSIVAHLFNNT